MVLSEANSIFDLFNQLNRFGCMAVLAVVLISVPALMAILSAKYFGWNLLVMLCLIWVRGYYPSDYLMKAWMCNIVILRPINAREMAIRAKKKFEGLQILMAGNKKPA